MVNPILIAVRRPCRLMLHGLLRVFPVLRRPGRARTPGDTTRRRLASLGCARSSPFASAKQRALQAAFITRPPPHPSHSFACEGPSARKTLRRPRSSKGSMHWTNKGSLPVLVLAGVAGASPRKAEGFFGLPSRTRQLCEGCGGVGCEKRCPKGAFFRACKGGSTPPKARWADEGASPSPDTGTPEKPVVARAAKQARASHRD